MAPSTLSPAKSRRSMKDSSLKAETPSILGILWLNALKSGFLSLDPRLESCGRNDAVFCDIKEHFEKSRTFQILLFAFDNYISMLETSLPTDARVAPRILDRPILEYCRPWHFFNSCCESDLRLLSNRLSPLTKTHLLNSISALWSPQAGPDDHHHENTRKQRPLRASEPYLCRIRLVTFLLSCHILMPYTLISAVILGAREMAVGVSEPNFLSPSTNGSMHYGFL